MIPFIKNILGFTGSLLLVFAASAQNYSIDWSVIGGGGGTSRAGTVILTGTIGQPYAGVMNAGTATVSSGFWGSLSTEPTALPQELIVNGSFENISGTFVLAPTPPGPNGVMLLPLGSTTIPGWTVVSAALLWGNIDLNGTVLPSGAGTPFGHFYVDLTGWLDTQPFAGVTQTIATTPNQTYQLSFALGTVENDYRWRGPVSVTVSAGSTSNVFTYTPSGTDWQWRTFNWNFTAVSASTPVTITGTSTTANLIALDNVSVGPAPAFNISAFGISGNQVRFNFPGYFGQGYVIESSAGLSTGAWATVPGTAITGSGVPIQVTIPIAQGQSRQFFRVRKLP